VIHQLFVIHDKKSKVFSSPQISPSPAAYLRGLEMDIKANPKSTLALYPDDFEIFHLGTYDSTTSFIDQLISSSEGTLKSFGLVSSLLQTDTKTTIN